MRTRLHWKYRFVRRTSPPNKNRRARRWRQIRAHRGKNDNIVMCNILFIELYVPEYCILKSVVNTLTKPTKIALTRTYFVDGAVASAGSAERPRAAEPSTPTSRPVPRVPVVSFAFGCFSRLLRSTPDDYRGQDETKNWKRKKKIVRAFLSALAKRRWVKCRRTCARRDRYRFLVVFSSWFSRDPCGFVPCERETVPNTVLHPCEISSFLIRQVMDSCDLGLWDAVQVVRPLVRVPRAGRVRRHRRRRRCHRRRRLLRSTDQR